MYKLDKESINRYWDEFPDKKISKIIQAVNDIQEIEYEQDNELLNKLAAALPKLNKLNFLEPQLNNIITILSRLDFKTSLRLMQILDEISEGTIETILEHAQNNKSEDDKFSVLNDRSDIFEKLSFFVTVFDNKANEWLQNEENFI